MNRKKKINQDYQKKKKIANQKRSPKNKVPYVSKADRAASEAVDTSESDVIL